MEYLVAGEVVVSDENREYVSVSRLTMYARCPAQYAFRYMEGLVKPPGVAMLVGSGTHTGAEVGMKHKATSGENMRPDDVRDAAVAGFDGRLGDGDVELTADEQSRGRPVVVGEARDRVAALSHFWAAAIQPGYWPMDAESVERRFRLPIESDLDLMGVVDLVTREGAVVDWKAGKRAVSQNEADSSLQLTAYALHHQWAAGRPPSEVQLAVIQEARETKHYVRRSSRDRTDYAILLRRIEMMKQAERAGIFPPCNPDNWWCSVRFCGYWRECPHVNSERLARATAREVGQ